MALTLTIPRKQPGSPGNPAWVPGRSGNPSGKPRNRSLVELCKANTEEAVKTLLVAMRFKGPQQVPAAIAILDRGWGRPAQRIEGDGVSHLHLHLLAAQLTEALTIEAQPEPQQQPVIEGSVPTE